MQDESVERTIKQYIANGVAEGAMAAAQKLSKALAVELDEVLAAVRGAAEPAAALADGSVTVHPPVASATALAPVAGVAMAHSTAIGSLTVIRQAEVSEVTRQASRGGLARLNANQRILVAVVLIAAIYPVLPPAVREQVHDRADLMAAITAVLTLMKR